MADLALMLENMPKGYRFRPTDEELVGHYLNPKLMGDLSKVWIIPEIDVCKYEPWDLPALSMIPSDDTEWFFFSPRDYKYSNSTRSNRATDRGFWKPTGKSRKIKVAGTNKVIGTKKTLVFYEGRVSYGVRTNWIIHEYHTDIIPSDQMTFVLCKLKKNPTEKKDEKLEEFVCEEGEPSSHMASDSENQANVDVIPDVYGFLNLDSIETPFQSDELDLYVMQLSSILNGQELSLPSSPLPYSYIGNDNSISSALT